MDSESPPTEVSSGMQIIWTRTAAHGLLTFRRPALKISECKGGRAGVGRFKLFSIVHSSANDTKDAIAFTLANDNSSGPVPVAGQYIYPVIELTEQDVPHPTPWARLMSVGPFSNWRQINRVAIKIQFQHEEQWVERVLKAGDKAVFMDKDAPGSLASYVTITALISYLRQQIRVNYRPWERNLGVARVKDITWDHLKQEHIVKDRPVETVRSLLPARLSQTVIRAALSAAMGPDTRVGGLTRQTNEPGQGGRSNHRKCCDACFLRYEHLSYAERYCERPVGGTDQCLGCWQMGTACTWTSTEQLLANTAAQEAVWFKRSASKVLVIEDPMIRTNTVDTDPKGGLTTED